MKFNIEGKAEIIAPTPRQITHALKSLRSYGKSSYASLTDASGSYVQVAGGGVSCMIERFQFGAQRWRAFHDKSSPVRPDGTILVFRLHVVSCGKQHCHWGIAGANGLAGRC
ncbi:hypothetical protein, partial [Burkholderia vietnamiensis]|uniref:hypothetical protein n=1 Tax=Burkholderia vietnamiensis TaxID=60552 RepID=UPI000A88B33F